MTTLHHSNEGRHVPAHLYPARVESILTPCVKHGPEQRPSAILVQNRLEAVEAWRFMRGLSPRLLRHRAGLSRADKLWALAGCAVCAMLCAWMFYNTNFATP